MAGLPFQELCEVLGKEPFYVRNLQRQLELPVPKDHTGYSESHAIFLEKVVALRAFHIAPDDIKELLDTEMKILRMLHVDSLTPSPTWHLEGCSGAEFEEPAADRLLLTGYRLGFALDAQAIQHTLDFGQRNPELFKGSEMGEDLRQVLRKYHAVVDRIKGRIVREKPVLENALEWARRILRRNAG